jgi:hypothetical protein
MPLIAVGLSLKSAYGFFLCEEAIQLDYETSVVLLLCPFVPEMTHKAAPGVFLQQLS